MYIDLLASLVVGRSTSLPPPLGISLTDAQLALFWGCTGPQTGRWHGSGGLLGLAMPGRSTGHRCGL